MKKMTWKEKYAGIIVLIPGLLYSILEIYLFFTDYLKISEGGQRQKTIRLAEAIPLADIRQFIIGLLCITGALLLFKIKRAGWIISTAAILNFMLITGWLAFSFARNSLIDLYFAFVSVMFVLLAVGLIFLYTKNTRQKFNITNSQIFMSLALFGGIAGSSLIL
jgi:hypothetical protein